MNTNKSWFENAGLGMFVHFGVYSVIGRGEWVMNTEKIPLEEYDRHILGFTAENYDPGEWARLAKNAGMTYMVLGTKHHDGFCLFDTSTTSRNAVKQEPKRDLVKEYAIACRQHGLKVGLYFSLPDWSITAFNDGPEKASVEAWNAYISLIHEQVHELCAKYGKIDVLWYDMAGNLNGASPLNAETLRAHELNAMVRKLQPDILINDRSFIPGDFDTAEQNIKAPKDGERLWEACLTMNKHWGYFPADDMYKSPKEIVHLLTGILSSGGNMLLNVGPRPDGSIGAEDRKNLMALGDWAKANSEAVYGARTGRLNGGTFGCSSQNHDKDYLYIHWWHGTSTVVPDCKLNFSSARILGDTCAPTIRHSGTRLVLENLPKISPNPYCSVIELTQI